MHVLQLFRKLVVRHFLDLSWQGLIMVLAGYILISWGLLWLAGERELVDRQEFFYWLVVTASTVGYGDLSPASQAGRWIVSLFVIPVGLGTFALVVGRVAAFSAAQWKKGIRGLKMINAEDHILVIGWNGRRSLQLLKLLVTEAEQHHQRRVVLCTMEDIENPLSEEIGFVRVGSFTDEQEMARTSISKASCIIINTSSDDLTMTTALFCNGVNKDAHIIVYFADDSLSKLLKLHCPRVECTPSVAIEMQAKAAMDPGSSALHQELLNAAQGMTQYSVQYPLDKPETTVDYLFSKLKHEYNATLIGVTHNGDQGIALNPPLTQALQPGSTLYYIADKRIQNFNWGEPDV